MADWHCTVGGSRYGPVSLDVLRQWIAEGRVKPSDLVWTEGMASWQPASGVAELGGAAPAPGGVPQPAYPQVYYPVSLPNAPGAVASMVCGIVGVCLGCAGLILGIIAIQQSRKAKELIARYPTQYGGGGMATAGLVLGIIGIVWGAFWTIYMIVIFSVIGFGFSAASGRF